MINGSGLEDRERNLSGTMAGDGDTGETEYGVKSCSGEMKMGREHADEQRWWWVGQRGTSAGQAVWGSTVLQRAAWASQRCWIGRWATPPGAVGVACAAAALAVVQWLRDAVNHASTPTAIYYYCLTVEHHTCRCDLSLISGASAAVPARLSSEPKTPDKCDGRRLCRASTEASPAHVRDGAEQGPSASAV
ncbi:hypothetical protein VTN02DRAFT_3610 [Thermoascus thermophilus]